MKCWRCGKENADVNTCLYCGVSQKRTTPITDIGKALRKIYDDFGFEIVLDDSRCITSALNDLIPESESFSHILEYVYHVGLGKTYKSQLNNGGKPDEFFYRKVKRIITEDADLSERKADQLICCFDEMIGWDNSEKPGNSSGSADSKPSNLDIQDTIIHNESFEERKTVHNRLQIGDEISFGHLNSNSFISWKVLKTQGQKALLICNRNICDMPYHQPGGSITWKDSTIRKWLNEDFINDHFSSVEKSKIISIDLLNENNLEHRTSGGKSTIDKVFLLSISEAESLFPDKESRSNGYWWWLRTPGFNPSLASYVDHFGRINTYGYGVHYHIRLGVRPALWIDLDS